MRLIISFIKASNKWSSSLILMVLIFFPLHQLLLDVTHAAVTPQITSGYDHTVALMSDGAVKAWGYNSSGQLGNDTTANSSTPVTVTGLGGTVSAIDAGFYHTVAFMSDGTVKAWGSNTYGQLGNGTIVNVIALGGTVTAIAAGDSRTVALMSDGTVKAWGQNDYGQLGNGTTSTSLTPVTVIGLGGPVSAIAVGYSHTLALMSDGTVKAWGRNNYGQLGNGTYFIDSSTPVTVTGLGGTVSAIASGAFHTVALKNTCGVTH